jgi:hypothetical protein
MQLVQGITGRSSTDTADEAPHVNPVHFKSTCYGVACLLFGRMTHFEPAGEASNFHSVVFELRDATVVAHCNATHPMVAFTEPADPDNPASLERHDLDFVDFEPLAKAFARMGDFQVMPAADLDLPVSEADLSLLDETERREIETADLRTVGDVVFRWID